MTGKKIRVVFVVPSLRTGGMERVVHLLATNLDPAFAAEVQVFDAMGELAEEATGAGIPVCLRPRRPGFLDLKLVRELAAAWRKDPPDVVHAHNSTAFIYSALAGWLAGGIPLVVTQHGRPEDEPLHDRLLHALLARRVDRVVVVAGWLLKPLLHDKWFRPDRAKVVPNGIDGASFTDGTDAGTVRAELDLPRDAPLVACVARLVVVKNHPLLLRAWRRIVARWPQAVLLLVGEGPEGEALERLVDQLGVRRSVRFLGTRHDVARLLKASDFHVLASSSEGMSLTLLEAMAAGRASVATAVGGNPEVIVHGVTGLLVPPGNEDGLADAMGSLIESPALATRMGAAAASDFRRRFTVRAMVRSYERLYRESIASRRPKRFAFLRRALE